MVKINSLGMAFLVTVLMISVFSCSVYALQLYDLASFEEEPVQGIKLGEGEGAQFDMFGGKHLIIIDDIDLESNDTDVKVFVFSKQVMKISLRPGVALRLDIDRDGATDVIVHLLKMEDSPEKRVSLIFESTGLSAPEVTGSAAKETDDAKGTVIRDAPNKTLTVVAVLVIALSLFLYSRKRKGQFKGNSGGKKDRPSNDDNNSESGMIDGGEGSQVGDIESSAASNSDDNREVGSSSVSAENIKVEATENL